MRKVLHIYGKMFAPAELRYRRYKKIIYQKRRCIPQRLTVFMGRSGTYPDRTTPTSNILLISIPPIHPIKRGRFMRPLHPIDLIFHHFQYHRNLSLNLFYLNQPYHTFDTCYNITHQQSVLLIHCYRKLTYQGKNLKQ